MTEIGRLKPTVRAEFAGSPVAFRPPRRLLIVEDSPTDRELLRYLLEARFTKEACIFEAPTLQAAFALLSHEEIECIILDLQLPDSTGRDTFMALFTRYPDIPLIVMTHNKDRQLALEMIQLGAADYVIKNFTDEEELFQRIVFAVEKHRHSVRVVPEDAASVRRLERAQADMNSAHQSGHPSIVREITVEVTSAIADLSRRTFAEMKTMSTQLVQIGTVQGSLSQTVDHLDQELLRGTAGRAAMVTRVDLLDHRLTSVEKKVQGMEQKQDEADTTQRREALELTKSHLSNRTKILIALLALIGTLIGAYATYRATLHKAAPEPAGATK